MPLQFVFRVTLNMGPIKWIKSGTVGEFRPDASNPNDLFLKEGRVGGSKERW